MKYDVAVVGAGFSAIAATINLLRLLPASSRIAVVGDDPGFGRGTAYRSEFYQHRLNVPAARMSIYPDQPEDFLDWLAEAGREVGGGDFASRSDFGLYLRDRLAALLRDRANRPRVDFIKSRAIGCIDISPSTTLIRLVDNDELAACHTILCLGVGTAPLPVPADAIAASIRTKIVDNPWRLGWLTQVGRDDRICMLGSGLTMVDQVLALRARGHRGTVDVLSRRGLVPHPHLDQPTPPVAPQLPDTTQLSALLQAIRHEVRQGAPWRSVLDGLRPQTQRLWQQLSVAQKGRFLRHALAWWTVHRHRLAPDVGREFQTLIDDGTVKVHAGYLQRIEASGAGALITYRSRGSAEMNRIGADWIVNCTGMERAGIRHSPLLQTMAQRGLLQGDPLGLGVVVDDRAHLVAADGRVHPHIFAVGALTAGRFWEITAVPDIRVQAQAVASEIAQAVSIGAAA
ncbi:FAD/NAD(P)-binding protein [Rhizobium sp. SAFR-030]|uniref:FAD/NAD(P)-binding protein n=1 Tax=Rhizobium sp. SAFR-030 TaxID=3387277 RepID=UPI003F819809